MNKNMNFLLSEKLRPQAISEVIGQKHILNPDSWLYKSMKMNKGFSILFFGPPGCGKTTIARLYAKSFDYKYISVSGVDGTISQIKKIIKDKKDNPLLYPKIILFVDEIHRFNKAQQDIFLPYLEDGTFILIGATTENPSFVLNNALLSRLRVITLKALDEKALYNILEKYDQKVAKINISAEARDLLVQIAQGDGRYLLNLIENLESLEKSNITLQDVESTSQIRSAHYDRAGDGHYQLISALHKSIRGSDPDSSLYWLARIINGGESLLYILRRLIRCASEDIGLADPQALQLAVSTYQAYSILGSPEGDLLVAQLVLYLALAPKSNQSYRAYKFASKFASKTSHFPPPKTIINAPTKWMKDENYGAGYIYDPDTEHGYSGQNYFPEDLDKQLFYTPNNIGFERQMRKRISYFQKLQRSLMSGKSLS